jgi:4-amino-4-deoxy-L-arabinose transferase-like glycosyltransferase
MRGRFPLERALAVGAVCAVSILGFLGAREVEGVRERRLAGAAADIDSHGHWLLPELLGEPRFLKPPLGDWLAAASLRLFGKSELAFRLPFGLAGLGMSAVAALLARRAAGAGAARNAALIFATTLYFVSECHSASTDLLLGLFAGLALLSWTRFQEDPRAGSAAWWCFHLSLALGFLSKGPVVLAITAIPILLELWASRRWELGLRAKPWRGLALVILPAIPWTLLVCLRLPDAPARWWADMWLSLGNPGTRSGWSRFSHLGNWPGFGFPWTVLGLGALALPLLRGRFPEWPRLRLLYFAVVGNLLFFSTWSMQPIHYLLPLAVPLAALEGALAERLFESLPGPAGERRLLWAARILCLSGAGLAAFTAVFLWLRASVWPPWAAAWGTLLAAPAVLALLRLRSRPRTGFRLLALTGLLSVLTFSGVIWPAVSRKKSGATFAREIARRVPPGEPVHFLRMREAMPFYADRSFQKLGAGGGGEETAARLRALGRGFILTERGTCAGLARSLEPAVEFSELLGGGEDPGGPQELCLFSFGPRSSPER